ncbi:syncytin-A-like [Kogia breviceps]|uniref:syncytin-A-like n=1 Tax=Kogia breviceps TaxID=27615 RepID=UPI0034D23272
MKLAREGTWLLMLLIEVLISSGSTMVSALGQHSAESMQAGTRCLRELPGGTTIGIKGLGPLLPCSPRCGENSRSSSRADRAAGPGSAERGWPTGRSGTRAQGPSLQHQALDDLSKNRGDALQGLCNSLDSLADVVLDNRLCLDYLLAEQGAVCALTKKTCCSFVSNAGRIEVNIQEIHEQAQRLHRYNTQGPDPSCAAIWSHRASRCNLVSSTSRPTNCVVLLHILGPCLLHCLVSFVTERIEAIRLQMILTQEYEQLGLQPGDQQTYFRLLRNSSTLLNQGKTAPIFSEKWLRRQNFDLRRPSRMRNSNKERRDFVARAVPGLHPKRTNPSPQTGINMYL